MLRDGDVVRERQRRVDVVRVEDGAQRGQKVGRRHVVRDAAGRDVAKDALRVREDEVQHVGAAGRLDVDRLDGVAIRRRRAVVQGGRLDAHRRIRTRDELRRVDVLRPRELAEVDSGVVAREADRVRDVFARADLADDDLRGRVAVGRSERLRDGGGVIAVVERDRRGRLPGQRDVELVVTARRADVERLRLADRAHEETGQRRGGERAGARVVRRGVGEVDGVGAVACVERQQARELVDAAVVAGDVDRVVAGARVDLSVPTDRLHVDHVGAAGARHGGRAAVRVLDREGVLAEAEMDLDRLEVRVGDPAGELLPGDDRLAAHPETREAVLRQHTDVVRGAVVVEHVQRVDLVGFLHARVRVERRDVVLVAGLRHHCLAACRVERPAALEGDLAARDER